MSATGGAGGSCNEGRQIEKPSRYTDKVSRYTDKSEEIEATREDDFPVYGQVRAISAL